MFVPQPPSPSYRHEVDFFILFRCCPAFFARLFFASEAQTFIKKKPTPPKNTGVFSLAAPRATKSLLFFL